MTAFISKDKKKFNLLYFLPLQNGRDRKSSIFPAPNLDPVYRFNFTGKSLRLPEAHK